MSKEIPLLVSACLLGQPVRYNAVSVANLAEEIDGWGVCVRLIPVCPEMLGGLPAPRAPAEIQLKSAESVIVHDNVGRDVTAAFRLGVDRVLQRALGDGCTMALMKSKSPSCGSGVIYDGTFSGTQIPGDGVTTALLKGHGIQVFTELQLDDLRAHLLNHSS